MKTYPPPHTSQWFEALMLRDTRKALHTMAVIVAADGNEEICGVCGDHPAFDYRLTGPKGWKGFPLRLCPDCREIRTQQMGEKISALPEPLPDEGTLGPDCPICHEPMHWVTFDFCCHRCKLSLGDAHRMRHHGQ